MSGLDVGRLVGTLNEHGVRYVMIGGMAAVAHGSPLPTEDVDIAPARDRENLDRLAAALGVLDARLRTGDPGGISFPLDGGFLAAQPRMLNLMTDAGDLDLAITPAGFPGGFDALVDNAVGVDLGDGAVTMIAALSDVIASKEAAGRDKDARSLPYLRALKAEIEAERAGE